MTQEQISDLRQKAHAATPGPWALSRTGSGFRVVSEAATTGNGYQKTVCQATTNYHTAPSKDQTEADMAFVAAANPRAALDLLAELDKTRELLAQALKLCWLCRGEGVLVEGWVSNVGLYHATRHACELCGEIRKKAGLETV